MADKKPEDHKTVSIEIQVYFFTNLPSSGPYNTLKTARLFSTYDA